MRFVKLSLSISVIWAMSLGCSSELDKSTEKADDFVPYYFTQTLEDADFIARGGRVQCEDEKLCSPSVGMLLFITQGPTLDYAVGQCTTFLILPKVLATNSHCIPPDLRTQGAPVSCQDRLRVFFPKIRAFDAESRVCSRVLFASKVASDEHSEPTRPDYAFIELGEPSTRPPLEISHEGAKIGSVFDVFKSDPDRSWKGNVIGNRGTIRHQKCTVVEDSLKGGFGYELGPLGRSGQCHYIPGNSGSPYLDERGRVRAILYARADLGTTGIQQALLRARRNIPEGGSAGFFSNFSCIPTPLDPPSTRFPKECAASVFDRILSQDIDVAFLEEKALHGIAEAKFRMKEWIKSGPRQIKWQEQLTRSYFGSSTEIFQPGEQLIVTLTPVPKCPGVDFARPQWKVIVSVDGNLLPVYQVVEGLAPSSACAP